LSYISVIHSGNPAKQKDNNIDILPPNSNQTTRRHLDKEDMPNPAAPITAVSRTILK